MSRKHLMFGAQVRATPGAAAIPTDIINKRQTANLVPLSFREVDGETNQVEVSFSSETPVQRYWGATEILGHGPDDKVSLSPLVDTGSLLLFHDSTRPVAKPIKVWIDEKDRKGRAIFEFPESRPNSKEALADVRAGILRGISVGYSVQKYLYDEEKDEARAIEWTVHEVSLTPTPADASVGVGRNAEVVDAPRPNPKQATTPGIRPRDYSRQGATAMIKLRDGREISLLEYEGMRALGMKIELADGQVIEARTIGASVIGLREETNEKADKAKKSEGVELDDTEDERSITQYDKGITPVEMKRRHDIRQYVALGRAAAPDAFPANVENDYILRDSTTCTAEVVRADVQKKVDEFRAKQGQPKDHTATPADGSRSIGAATGGEDKNRASFREAAVDAILMRGGIKVEKPHERAREFMYSSISEIMDRSLVVSGRSDVLSQPKDERVRLALESRDRSPFTAQGDARLSLRSAGMGHTSSDFPLILANVANKALQTGYELANVTYNSGWARIVNIEDFKTRSVVALSEAPDLDIIGENGEFTEGRLSEKREQYALETYGKIISITRKAIINDDLDAFIRIPQIMGGAARRKINRVLYSILKTNAALSDSVALFHSTHANIGTAGALSITTLAELKKLMRMQAGLQPAASDTAASLLNIEPRFLLVGPSQEEVALQLLANASMLYAAQSSNTVSPWIRNLVPVVEPELENTPDAATGDFFLSASPLTIDTVELGLLNGVDAPYMEEQMGFDVDGMRFKVRVDVGAKAIDYRGLAVNRAS